MKKNTNLGQAPQFTQNNNMEPIKEDWSESGDSVN